MFKKWCREKGFYNNSSVSHVLMDGGVLSVPYDKLDQFYDKYVECVKKNERIFVVEQKTKSYNFFVDVDYKDEESLTLEQASHICEVICKTVSEFKKSKCLITLAKPKPKDNMMKTGIHLNWPGIQIERDMALNLRDHIIHELKKSYSEVDWESVIDNSVYGDIKNNTNGSGFRMPWSHKKSKHQGCSGVGCQLCSNGKIDEGPYIPFFIVDEECNITRTSQDIKNDILWMATIRTNDPSEVTTVPEKKKKEGDFTKSQVANKIVNTEVQSLLETFIREHIEGQKHSRVLDLFLHKEVVLVKTNSMYCENIQRKHNSNHIYFVITKEGVIFQKCFCRCETYEGRKYENTLCRDFSGKKHRISDKITKKLFTNTKIKQIENNVYTHLSYRPVFNFSDANKKRIS